MLRQKRRWRIRKKVNGTADRPRLTVCFTNKHIHAQCVDDVEHKTLVSASTLSKGEKAASSKSNIAGAKDLGREIAEKLWAERSKLLCSTAMVASTMAAFRPLLMQLVKLDSNFNYQ